MRMMGSWAEEDTGQDSWNLLGRLEAFGGRILQDGPGVIK